MRIRKKPSRLPVSIGASLATIITLLSLTGCGGGSGSSFNSIRRMQALLSGQQVVTPVNTEASGLAVVELYPAQQKIHLHLDTRGPFSSPITMVHIHAGAPGQNGPHILDVFAGEEVHDHPVAASSQGLQNRHVGGVLHPGGLPPTLDKELTPQQFTPAPSHNIHTFADAIAAMQRGETYINVHTQANPGGVLRGQILPPTASG